MSTQVVTSRPAPDEGATVITGSGPTLSPAQAPSLRNPVPGLSKQFDKVKVEDLGVAEGQFAYGF